MLCKVCQMNEAVTTDCRCRNPECQTTPAEIQERCAMIRATWPPHDKRLNEGPREWSVPVMHSHYGEPVE